MVLEMVEWIGINSIVVLVFFNFFMMFLLDFDIIKCLRMN